MDILLDTHVALWALDDSPLLSKQARELILDGGNRVFVSDVSAWEIATKHVSHPDKMPSGAARFIGLCREAGYLNLPLSPEAVVAYENLDIERAASVHKDPYDRMLIAQSKVAKMLFLTHDKTLSLYGEPLVCIV
ncbi:MAG: type II toxin-antitoxin system VapC family toxin [Eggerthellaceae bacterium]|nr:type II toxin-antitoxin system VapC family toxin [Eggerthellaceae bacterium]